MTNIIVIVGFVKVILTCDEVRRRTGELSEYPYSVRHLPDSQADAHRHDHVADKVPQLRQHKVYDCNGHIAAESHGMTQRVYDTPQQHVGLVPCGRDVRVANDGELLAHRVSILQHLSIENLLKRVSFLCHQHNFNRKPILDHFIL